MQTYYHDTRNDDYWLIEPRGARAKRAIAAGRLHLKGEATSRIDEPGAARDGAGGSRAEPLHAYRIFPEQVPEGEALRSGEGPPTEYFEEQARRDRENGAVSLDGQDAMSSTPGFADLLLAAVDHLLAPDDTTRAKLEALRGTWRRS